MKTNHEHFILISFDYCQELMSRQDLSAIVLQTKNWRFSRSVQSIEWLW